MIKIFTASQTKTIDLFTIENEPISSIDLMERAARVCTEFILKQFPSRNKFVVFAGTGNNGGDGYAIARQLLALGKEVVVYCIHLNKNFSNDASINLQRLKETDGAELHDIYDEMNLPRFLADEIGIDAILGSGINKKVDGPLSRIIKKINQYNLTIVSIDIPSGLFTESNSENDMESVIRSTYTLTFSNPFLSFLFPENHGYVGDFHTLDIGLHVAIIENMKTQNYCIEECDIVLKRRDKFSHKGNFGHALLIAGSYGMMGASVLAAKACLRSGVGLLSVHCPSKGYGIIQTAVPEAMANIDRDEKIWTELPSLSKYNAIGIGPGIGIHSKTKSILLKLIKSVKLPLVIDADGLNLMAQHKKILASLPSNSILTPHPGEFDRLFGNHENHFQRVETQKSMSLKYNIIIVLKGAHTCISLPDGSCYFNMNGNPAMATGGSGDVLTGIILALLAQNYSPKEAAINGFVIHGKAGGEAYKNFHTFASGDIIKHINIKKHEN